MNIISLRMGVTLILSAVAALITPLLLRTAIDGIITTDDQEALIFALTTIAWIELIGVFCDFSFRRDLNEATQNFIHLTKTKLLKKMADGLAAIKPEELERLFLRDLKAIANSKIKDRWVISKECLTLLLMGTLTFFVSPTAGMLLVFLLFVHIGFGYWTMMTSKNKTRTWFAILESEEALIKLWSTQNAIARDGGFSNMLYSQTVSSFESLGNDQNTTSSFREHVDAVFKVFRTLSIFGILIIALVTSENLGDSAGTLTALLLIMFRIVRPMEAISKWALQDLKTEMASLRVNKWLDNNILTRGEPPENYNSAKKFLEHSFSHLGELRSLTANASEISDFLECSRIWRDRVSGKCKVLIFHDSFDLNILSAISSPHLVILNEFSKMNDPAQASFRRLIFAKKNPWITFICCDPIHWSPHPNHAATVVDKQFKIVDPIGHERYSKIIEYACQTRPDIAELRRDLGRYQRLSTPLSIVILKLTAQENSLFRGSMRNFDHLVNIGGEEHLYSLANCNSENLLKALARMEKVIARPIEVLYSKTFGQYPIPPPQELSELMLFFAKQLIRSESIPFSIINAQEERNSA